MHSNAPFCSVTVECQTGESIVAGPTKKKNAIAGESAHQKSTTLTRDALTARECIERASRQKQGKVTRYLHVYLHVPFLHTGQQVLVHVPK